MAAAVDRALGGAPAASTPALAAGVGDTVEPAPISVPVTAQPAAIASSFDAAKVLVTVPIPPSGAPDIVGAFRFICAAGQLRYDDPVVFPGQPDKSHLHQFYGNESADAYSTFARFGRPASRRASTS